MGPISLKCWDSKASKAIHTHIGVNLWTSLSLIWLKCNAKGLSYISHSRFCQQNCTFQPIHYSNIWFLTVVHCLCKWTNLTVSPSDHVFNSLLASLMCYFTPLLFFFILDWTLYFSTIRFYCYAKIWVVIIFNLSYVGRRVQEKSPSPSIIKILATNLYRYFSE